MRRICSTSIADGVRHQLRVYRDRSKTDENAAAALQTPDCPDPENAFSQKEGVFHVPPGSR